MRFIHACLVGILLFPFTAPLDAGELVMVERHGCHWCDRWNEEIAHIYPKTDEGKRAPLRRVNIQDMPNDIDFASRPVFTPTFILVEDGVELARVEGYSGPDFFWFLLTKMLDAHPDATQMPEAPDA